MLDPSGVVNCASYVLRVGSSEQVAVKASLVCQVVFHFLLREGDGLRLVAGDSVEPPGEQSYPLGQHLLQVPLGRETLQDTDAVLLPIFDLLHSGDDWSRGADAVAGGVPAHHLLAFLGRWSSFGQTRIAPTT